MRFLSAFLIMAATLGAGNAAELPSRDAKPPAQKAKRCEIAGQPGILTANGRTCVRVSGYVSSQATAGGALK